MAIGGDLSSTAPMLFRFALGMALLFSLEPPARAGSELAGESPPDGAVWLDDLDVSAMTTGFGKPVPRGSVTGNPLSVGGQVYAHGVGTHADSEIAFDLDGGAELFVTDVGVDDELSCLGEMGAAKMAAVRFRAFVDGKLAADSGVVRTGPAKRLTVPLVGAKRLRLEVKKVAGARFNHVDWAGAHFRLKPGAAPPRALPSQAEPQPVAARLSKEENTILEGVLQGHAPTEVVWVETLELERGRFVARQNVRAGATPAGGPLVLKGRRAARGFALDGEGEFHIKLDGRARRFVARVGIDNGHSCAKALSGGGALVEVWTDGKQALASGVLHGYDAPIDLSVNLEGVKTLVLVSRLADGPVVTTTWAGAAILTAPQAAKPIVETVPNPPRPAIARRRPEALGIHGPTVVGASPGKPFLFRVPATGKKPLSFSAPGLPPGLTLDPATGIIEGKVANAGNHRVLLRVKDASGAEAERALDLEIGPNKLALTPPMGWNSWNVWGLDVADDKIRRAADALIASGLADHGFSYVNIDDAWEGQRDGKGEIHSNQKFPDMKALSDYVHAKGLKLGIYSSPGPKTCGQYEGSYKHEAQDARTFATWGIDLLKYDWCSYGSVAKGNDRHSLMKPYAIMGRALRASGRDVLYSLCQYGRGSVWEWGRQVGGHFWRTTGDIVDTWGSVDTIGFGQAGKESFAGPGGWNDPDMLVVGNVGWSANVRPTRLTPAEQVTHVTLWSLLAAPLLLGNDLEKLDDWTLDLLSNDEVIDVNQDRLGKAAGRVSADGPAEIWARPLADGTHAVGVFNRSPVSRKVRVDWSSLSLEGKQPVRDVWQRHDLGTHESLELEVLPHGAMLLKVGSPRRS